MWLRSPRWGGIHPRARWAARAVRLSSATPVWLQDTKREGYRHTCTSNGQHPRTRTWELPMPSRAHVDSAMAVSELLSCTGGFLNIKNLPTVCVCAFSNSGREYMRMLDECGLCSREGSRKRWALKYSTPISVHVTFRWCGRMVLQ